MQVVVRTDLVIGESSQQVLKACVMEGLLSGFKLVPERHTLPENQIRSSMIGFTEIKDTVRGESGSDATYYVGCVWRSVANGR